MASLSARFLRTGIPAAVVLSSTIFYNTASLHADEGRLPMPTRPGRSSSGDKLPIYPQPEAAVTLIETPHPLTGYIAQARETTTGALSGAGGYVEGGVSRWIGFERKVERELKTVLPPDESLTPGIIYVLIAGLTGSVLTRTRSFPIRWLTPPLLAIGAAPYFLPKTSHNIRQYLSNQEDKYLPEFAAAHDQWNHNISTHLSMISNKLGNAGETARGYAHTAVQEVEKTTGLKVSEAVRAGQEKAQREVQKVDEIRKMPVERVGYVVEQKPIAEIVKPVEQPEIVAPGKRIV